MSNSQSLIGRTFGRLKVIGDSKPRVYSSTIKRVSICKCQCGTIKNVANESLARGTTKSCGCLRRELLTTHGHTSNKTKSRTFSVWSDMMARCLKPNNKYFHHYGGRGIGVSEHWHQFENFLADMGPKPAGKSICRIVTGKHWETAY